MERVTTTNHSLGRQVGPTSAVFLALVLAACTSITPVTPPSGASPSAPASGEAELPAEGPSRVALIEQAVESGQIDQVTGLLYRAYSALGMPELPEEFAAGVPRQDDSALVGMAMLMPTLSPEDQARLRPFVVRPTDPESIFASQPTALLGDQSFAQAPPGPRCTTWANSENGHPKFKVWACADRGNDVAQADIATASAIIEEAWGPMTQPVPQGMGEPLADAYGSDPAKHGGDERIDFYLLDLNQILYRNGDNQVVKGAAAMAASDKPETASGASSGFVLLNRSRLPESTKMKQDVIHEFFHILQFAHNVKATHHGDIGHWFTEASAKWAETYYYRIDSDDPHGWFPAHFQPSLLGLEDPDEDHQNAAYIWPFFMEQEKGKTAVFEAWSAIDSLAAGDFAGVSAAIDRQLPFETNFREFALRNLNLSVPLASSGAKRYNELDPRFYQDKPPTHMVPASIQPGAPYVSPETTMPPLAARYFNISIAPLAKEVTISTSGLSPAGQVDGDALVHLANGNWQRRPVDGGVLKFCRDDAADNIDQVYLVVSNHSRTGPAGGSIEASAKESCDEVARVMGDFSWSQEIVDTLTGQTITTTTSGTVHLDMLWDPITGFQPQGDSRYSYAYSISNCSPNSSFAGTIERSGEPQPAQAGVASLNILGGRPGQDIQFGLDFADTWMAACDYGGGAGDAVETSAMLAFPGCLLYTQATALWDGSSNYVINCQPPPDDPSHPGRTISGQVTGTLTNVESASPRP